MTDTGRMAQQTLAPLKLHVEIEQWPLASPFQITGHTFEFVDVLVVSLTRDELVGRGEAAGVYYKNDRPRLMVQQIEEIRPVIEAGTSREAMQQLLPPGGARNALDCALWDLEAKVGGYAAWQIAELKVPRPLVTTFTCGADEPRKMAATACGFKSARAIKVKLTGQPIDADRVRAVREARQDVWLGVDANQGFTRVILDRMMPAFIDVGVELIEQPFPTGQEALLDGFQSPIPIAADESVQSLCDMQSLVGRFNVVNIKLDKCGGLTEAFRMVRFAHELGIGTMVGNMLGTSLAMAPAFLVGQLCKVVDLDGPALLGADRDITVDYSDGYISCPDCLWGSP